MQKKEKRKKKILKNISNEIKNKPIYKNVSVDTDNYGTEFIWVGIKNGQIGTSICHYEFVFRENELHMEVHFEGEPYQIAWFQNIILPQGLFFSPWNQGKKTTDSVYKKGSIVFEENKFISVDDQEIVSKALGLLDEMHKAIGEKLKKILFDNIPVEVSENEGTPVLEIEKKYSALKKGKAKVFISLHGKIQEKLKEQLNNNDCEAGFEMNIKSGGDVKGKIDLLVYDKKKKTYTVYEVKPDDKAMDCIKTALGQILYYKVLLERSGKTVDKLVIAGPSELAYDEEQYFEKMKKYMGLNVKLEYMAVPVE